jgi:prefoldin subunit 5
MLPIREEKSMKNNLRWLVLSLMFFLGVQPVVAQTTQEYQDLKKEIESLKQGQAGLKQDLQEIKKLIQGIKQAPAARAGGDEFKEAIINIEGAPIRGDKKAKLVMIEFTDYQ